MVKAASTKCLEHCCGEVRTCTTTAVSVRDVATNCDAVSGTSTLRLHFGLSFGFGVVELVISALLMLTISRWESQRIHKNLQRCPLLCRR